MNPEKEVTRWRDTIRDLQKQLEAARARVADLGETKKPLTLAGLTGDSKAKSKLAEINAEIRVVEQETADLAEAISQAEAKLSEAQAQKARLDEMERLKEVREIAENRIELAAVIEEKAQELANLCEELRQSGFAMGRAGDWPVGDERCRRADAGGRIRLCLQKNIGPWFEDPANPLDPRIGQTLADMERDALSGFLLSDRGIKKLADGAA
jgi:cell pole-organizing protein PopZ